MTALLNRLAAEAATKVAGIKPGDRFKMRCCFLGRDWRTLHMYRMA